MKLITESVADVLDALWVLKVVTGGFPLPDVVDEDPEPPGFEPPGFDPPGGV